MTADSPTAASLSRVPHLPTPYDDELLYSIVARYGMMTGYIDSVSANLDLFGSSFGHASSRAPTALSAMANRLPASLNLSARDLVTRHTLVPYYYAYFPDDRREKAILETLSQDRRANKAAGMDAKPLSPPRRLKFCPECLDAMESLGQDLHWKRVHQLAIVSLCPEHECELRLSSVTPTPAERKLHPATRVNCSQDAPTIYPRDADVDRGALLELARGAQNLLQGKYPANAARQEAVKLAQLFRDLGYKRKGRIDWKKLQPEVQKVTLGLEAAMPGIDHSRSKDNGWLGHALDPRRVARSDRVIITAILIDRIEAIEPRFWAAVDDATGEPFMDLPIAT